MAYLDSAGNVDPTAGPTVVQWAAFHRTQQALGASSKVNLPAPAISVPAGAEKATKGTH